MPQVRLDARYPPAATSPQGRSTCLVKPIIPVTANHHPGGNAAEGRQRGTRGSPPRPPAGRAYPTRHPGGNAAEGRQRGFVHRPPAGLDPWLVYRAVYLIVMVTTVALAATRWQERIMGATRLVQTKIGLTDQQRNDLYGRIKHIAFRPAATALVTALGVSLCLFLITGEFWT